MNLFSKLPLASPPQPESFRRSDRHPNLPQKRTARIVSKNTLLGVGTAIAITFVFLIIISVSLFGLLGSDRTKELTMAHFGPTTQLVSLAAAATAAHVSETTLTIILFISPLALLFLLILVFQIFFQKKI